MARIVLKDPNSPSVKKTMKPPSIKYKKYFYRMVFVNFIQMISIFYLLNKQQADIVLLPIINKLKQLL